MDTIEQFPRFHSEHSLNLNRPVTASVVPKLPQGVTFDPGILESFDEIPMLYIENQFKLIQNDSNPDSSER